MALHGDQLISGAAGVAGDVRVQLIQRFVTDAACAAVFEKKHGAFAGLGDGGLELSEVGQSR
jgi:hypothetical protein